MKNIFLKKYWFFLFLIINNLVYICCGRGIPDSFFVTKKSRPAYLSTCFTNLIFLL